MTETEIDTNDAEQVTLTREQIALIVKLETERKREDALPKSALMERPPWNRKLIDDILGGPDSTPKGPSGYHVQFYALWRIEFAEKYLKYWDGK